jgi:flagellar hook assembly protein FlgD
MREIDRQTLPTGFDLYQNYPNPFNPATKIRFSLPASSHVKLDVYDIKGRKVATLVDGYRAAGNHTVIWEGRDSAGNLVASGIYFYRIEAGDLTGTKKMLLLK